MKAILAAFLVMSVLVVSGCTTEDDTGLLLIESDMTLSQDFCSENGLEDKVLVLESKYCSACRKALPILEEIEEELNASFIYLDISQEENFEKMESYGIKVKYTPTTIAGCKVMIGAKSKEDFNQVIEPFWNSL